MSRVIDWPSIWTDLAKERDFGMEAFEPIPVTIGGLGDKKRFPTFNSPFAQRKKDEESVVWIERSHMAGGLLGLHKAIAAKSMDRWLSGWFHEHESAGTRHTAYYLDRIARQAAPGETLAKSIFKLFSAASAEEFINGHHSPYVQNDSRDQYMALRAWLQKERANFSWHHTSSRLAGHGDSFLDFEDFDRYGPATDFYAAVVNGHKRIMESYALIRPTYQEEAPAEIATEFSAWLHEEEEAAAAAKAARLAEWEAERQREAEAKAVQVQKRKALLAPERREKEMPALSWHGTSNERLQELLKTAPMTELAIRFGVSETMIRKRAKAANLTVPARGYWLRNRPVTRS